VESNVLETRSSVDDVTIKSRWTGELVNRCLQLLAKLLSAAMSAEKMLNPVETAATGNRIIVSVTVANNSVV